MKQEGHIECANLDKMWSAFVYITQLSLSEHSIPIQCNSSHSSRRRLKCIEMNDA